MPKGYVSFDSGVFIVLVVVEVLCGGRIVGVAALTRVGAASTHTQVQWDQMPMGYVSFDSGVPVVPVSVEVLRDDGAAVVAVTIRVGAASTHTQVQSDQMPKDYVSFDSVSVWFDCLNCFVGVMLQWCTVVA